VSERERERDRVRERERERDRDRVRERDRDGFMSNNTSLSLIIKLMIKQFLVTF
jgi:hypothetical protein